MTRRFFKKYRHLLLFALFLLSGVSYFSIQFLAKEPLVIHVAWDDRIPFLPAFILPYVAWYVYIPLPMLYAAFCDKPCFYRQCGILFPGLFLCMLFFIVYPTAIDFRPTAEGPGLLNALCRLVFKNDRPLNVFPSLHVYESIAIHLATFRGGTTLQKKTGLRIVSFVVMCLICISTVFVKQHSVIDVIGGILLSAVVYAVYSILHLLTSRKKGE